MSFTGCFASGSVFMAKIICAIWESPTEMNGSATSRVGEK